jgi:hypothetical protein
MMPNQAQVVGALRIIIPMVCTWLVAKGFAVFSDSGIVADIVNVVIGLVAVVYSFLAHTDAAKLKSAADVNPQIQIQVPRELMIDNKGVASLVHDDATPNVTKLNEAPKPYTRGVFTGNI